MALPLDQAYSHRRCHALPGASDSAGHSHRIAQKDWLMGTAKGELEGWEQRSVAQVCRKLEEKTRWSSAILVDAKKQTWRNARDATLRDTGEPTWEGYKEWCLNQVRNPAVESQDVGRQLAKASMKETQSVASFNDYLASLWAQRDRVVTDAECKAR